MPRSSGEGFLSRPDLPSGHGTCRTPSYQQNMESNDLVRFKDQLYLSCFIHNNVSRWLKLSQLATNILSIPAI